MKRKRRLLRCRSVPSDLSFSLSLKLPYVSRGYRAAQRYSPGGGRRRRSARLFSGKAISTTEGSATTGGCRSLRPRMEGTAAKPVNWLALFAIGIATVTIANDFSAINVALPTMEGDFHTNINTIQWVVNAYALTFGVMIVTGGRLADMFGRRNAFFLGAALFALFSAAGGAAPNETILIVTRALMGVGAALM